MAAGSSAARRDHGVIICPPIAQEHVRAYWALRQVAVALTRAGFDCLRFDWFGVGDSSGELKDATIDRWRADVAAAAQELRDSSGVRTISVVGLRMGASIATLAAKTIRPKNLVLWDPIVSGKTYIDSLKRLTATVTTDSIRYWNPNPKKAVQSHELVGFDFGEKLIAEIEQQIAVSENEIIAAIPTSTNMRILSSCDDAEVDSFIERARAKHPGILTHKTEVRVSWVDHGDVEELLLPGDCVPSVVRLLLGSQAPSSSSSSSTEVRTVS
jgi:pimeloyl-ACP methyl ester carboxylesterase